MRWNALPALCLGVRAALVSAAVAVLLPVAGCGGGEAGTADSADGRIVFSSSRDGDFEIYAMNPDGGDVRQLTENRGGGTRDADDQGPVWSPDGSRIVFASARDHTGDGSDNFEVYVMEADGSAQTRLTENEELEGNPAWSPDGESILFVRRIVPGGEGFELALMSDDGTGAETVLEIDGYGAGAFSPDGSQVAFTRCRDEQGTLDCEIWVASADGSDRRLLVDSRGRDGDVAWSPDGTRIAFTSDRDRNGQCFFHDCWGHNGEIYVMSADGSDQRRVTDNPGDDQFPTWSPDGTRIAFAGLRDVEGAVDAPEENYEIYVTGEDGSDVRQLTDNTTWDWHPDWR
jgi:Tol biopolymer transport system component